MSHSHRRGAETRHAWRWGRINNLLPSRIFLHSSAPRPVRWRCRRGGACASAPTPRPRTPPPPPPRPPSRRLHALARRRWPRLASTAPRSVAGGGSQTTSASARREAQAPRRPGRAVTRRLHGGYMAVIWRLHGGYTKRAPPPAAASESQIEGGYTAVTWRSHDASPRSRRSSRGRRVRAEGRSLAGRPAASAPRLQGPPTSAGRPTRPR